VIRDLKDQALRHFPSGQFNTNSAWSVIASYTQKLWMGLRRKAAYLPGC